LKTIQIPRRYVRHAWGGIETAVSETSKRMSSWGHDVGVVCPNALAELDHEIIEGVEVRRVPYFYPYVGLGEHARQQLDYRGGNMFSLALYRLLRQEQGLDLIHLHTGKRIGGIARRVARARGIPYVITLHGGVFDVPVETEAGYVEPTAGSLEWGKVLGWWAGSRRVLQDADAVITLGEEERHRAQDRLPNQRVECLPHGVDIDRFSSGNGSGFRNKYGIPQHAPVILNVARIDTQKNQILAVQSLLEVRRAGTPAHMVLLGPVTDPDYLVKVQVETSRLGLERHVTIIPGIDADSPDLVNAYHAAEAFLLSSRHEPFGIVLLEAWAAGLPVVATAVGGVPHFVEHGRTGLLVSPGEAQAAADALVSVLSTPGLGARLAYDARLTVRAEYGWDQITSRLLTLYEELSEASGTRSREVA